MKQATYPSILLTTLLLAACGGGGSDSTESVTASTSTAATSMTVAQATSTNIDSSAGTQAAGASPAVPLPTPVANVIRDTSTSTVSDSEPVVAPSPAPASDTASTPAPTPAPASSDTTPAQSPAPAPAPIKATQIIEYYGDSTVWGYATNVGGQVAQPAPGIFSAALPTTPVKYDVRNHGVSASTACDLLNGTDGRHPNWDTQMASSQADYVIFNHAINDQWKYDVATYKSCLSSLANKAKSSGKKVIFETPNPTRDSGSWGLDIYVNAMKEVAGQVQAPVIDQYTYLTEYLNGRSAYTICPDGLHPTDEVYVMKGRFAASVFQSLFPAN